MAAPRRVARRVETAHWSTFEDQLWPINVALVVLGGFVAGAIMAAGQFDEPSIVWNAWTHLATLAISLGGLVWLACVLDNQRLRRNVQLSALLSLLVHVLLALVLYKQQLTTAAYQEPDDAYDFTLEEERRWPVQMPTDQPSTEYLEAPVEAAATADAPAEIAREQPQFDNRSTAGEPTPLPGIEPNVQPSLVELRAAEQAPSRRAETASLLSRQSAIVPPVADEPIAAPQLAASASDSQQPGPQVDSLERQRAELASQRPAESTALEVAQEQQAAELARRESTEAPAAASSLAMLDRRLNDPIAAPTVEADAPQPVATAAEPSPVEPQASTSLARVASAAPQPAIEPAPSPVLAAGPIVARVEAARQAVADRPSPVNAPQPLVGRTNGQPGESVTALADAPAVPDAAAGEPRSPLAAPATGVARATPAVATAAADITSDAAASIASAKGGPNVSRATATAATPSINGVASSSPRAPAASAVGTSATAEPVPAPSANPASQGAARAEPTPMALARGSAAPVGSGTAASFEAGGAAADVSAQAPSASARRAEASQRGPLGEASVPSAPARIARSIAGAAAPQATLAADDAPHPDALGAARPSRLEANASAALARANSAAPAGRITAGAGKSNIDLGPTQAVAPAGPGRPAAGGGASIGPSLPNAALARAASPPAIGGGAAANVPAPSAGTAAPRGGKSTGEVLAAAGAANAVQRAAPASGAPRASGGPDVSPADAGAIATAVPARASAAAAAQPSPTAVVAGGSLIRATGSAASADSRADTLNLPAGPSPAPAAGGAAPTAVADRTVRSAAGIPGRATAGPVGVQAGSLPTDSRIAGSPGVGLSKSPTAGANSDAPSLADIATAGTLRKASVAGLPDATAAGVAEPALAAPARAAPSGPVVGSPVGESTALARSAGSLPVQISAPAGPGGFGPEWTPDVGSVARRARDDVAIVSAGAARFLGRTSGGPLAIDGRAREPAEAFANRRVGRGGEGNAAGRPSQRTERAVELGLAFLARHQAPDGRWSLHGYAAGRRGYEAPATLHSDTAATGLALLAFLGAGYDHFGDRYQEAVAEGLKYLVAHQQPSGDLYLPEDDRSNENMRLYSHGIATIAVCEAYGMTGDPDLAEPAQRAIDFIVSAQHRQLGGWRYKPQVSADTSVTGWQLMALKSGELAGLKVPPDAYDLARKWLDGAAAPDSAGAQYVYDPFAAKVKGVNNGVQVGGEEGKKPNQVMTAVGLLMRLYLGWNRETPAMRRGADYLAVRLPAIGTRAAPTNDAYYWYYTTQVMFHMRGEYWRAWHERLHALLVERQVQTGALAGSWDPLGPVPDRWGPHAGRIYVTALHLLSLEVTYRHLPIYESTAK